MAHGRFKPSKAQAREFSAKMDEIRDFCIANNIRHSASYDSYYFCVNGVDYRVSNHSVEASDSKAFDPFTGEQWRDFYHGGRSPDVRYIHAGKTRIMEIYNDLKNGYELDGRGNRKEK